MTEKEDTNEKTVFLALALFIMLGAAVKIPEEPIALTFDRSFIFMVQSDARIPLFIGIV